MEIKTVHTKLSGMTLLFFLKHYLIISNYEYFERYHLVILMTSAR